MLTVEWLRSVDDLAAIERGWRDLEQTVSRRTHLSTFDFLATWYRHYAGEYGGAPLVGVMRLSDRIVAVAPFAICRGRMGHVPVTRVEIAPTDVSAGECLVDDGHSDLIGVLIEALARDAAFDVIALDSVAPQSPELAAIRRSAVQLGCTVETEDQPYAVADLRHGYSAYVSGLSGNTRRKLAQKTRRAATLGMGIEGVHLTAPADVVERAAARMIAITEASYKLGGRRLADCHRGFLSEVAARLAARGMLSLPILTIGGRDAAFILGAVERGTLYDISIAYDESFAPLSPGAILMQHLLARLAETGVHSVVSHGAHEYKRRWASAFVPRLRVLVFTPHVRARAARFVRFGLAPFWQRVAGGRAPDVSDAPL